MNCKPGDLAYIVRSDDPASIGAVVEVVETCLIWTGMTGVQHWRMRAPRALATIGGTLSQQGAIEDCRLRRIGGVPVETEEGAEVVA